MCPPAKHSLWGHPPPPHYADHKWSHLSHYDMYIIHVLVFALLNYTET